MNIPKNWERGFVLLSVVYSVFPPLLYVAQWHQLSLSFPMSALIILAVVSFGRFETSLSDIGNDGAVFWHNCA